MAADFVPQELPPEVSAREAMRVSDAEYAKRLGFVAEPEPEAIEEKPGEEEVVEEKPEEKVIAEEKPVEEKPEDKGEESVEGEEEPEEEKPEEKAEPRKLLTKFSVSDDKGELEIPDSLTFSFKANGKEYENVPIDKVVLLAQQGVYNHEQYQKASEALALAQQTEARYAELETEKKELESYYEQLFQNPEFYEKARMAFLQTRTPEAVAARAQQELAARDQRDQQEKAKSTRQGFVSNYLVPKMTALLQENPTVNQDELLGRWTVMTAPLIVRGEIPVDRLADVQARAENELTQWVRSLHLERSAEAARSKKVTEDASRKVKVAKRQLARAAAPPATSTPTKPTTRKFTRQESAQDWFNHVFGQKEE